MGELMTKEEELAKAETASHDIPREQPDGPKLVKGQKAEAPDKAAAIAEPVPLFSESEMKDFRRQAGSCGDAATGRRFRQRANGFGKAVGKRRQRVH
jgi:hypothetical protein